MSVNQQRVITDETRLEVTDQDSDVTTTIAGANGWETVWDLSPSTDIYYYILPEDHPQLNSAGNLRIRMQLPQEGAGSTEIGDNAQIRIVARGPVTDDTGEKLGRTFRYRSFSQPNQYDNENVVRLRLDKGDMIPKITEAGHLEVQVNNPNNNDVDLSQNGGFLSVELYRGTM